MRVVLLSAIGAVSCLGAPAPGLPDLSTVPPDLVVPPMTEQAPAKGLRVKQTLPAYLGTGVYHTLYLPVDWEPGRRYPIIMDYPGNGNYSNKYGDVSTGRPEGLSYGYGASGGRGFIWLCMPFINEARNDLQLVWWGDLEATADYGREAVRQVCEEHGGDPNAVILSGFSRGAIACGYLGLHDDTIADLWLAFMPYSMYDGLKETWGYPGADRTSARERLVRIQGRASFVSSEHGPPNSVEDTRALVEDMGLDSPFTYVAIPFRNHNDAWTLRDIPERRRLREWLATVLRDRPGTHSLQGRVTDSHGAGMAEVRIESGSHWVVTDADGRFVLPGLVDGNRRVRAAKESYRFRPDEMSVTLSGADLAGIAFQASPLPHAP